MIESTLQQSEIRESHLYGHGCSLELFVHCDGLQLAEFIGELENEGELPPFRMLSAPDLPENSRFPSSDLLSFEE